LQNELRKLDFNLSGLKPKGEWEEQMFRDKFQSNTSLMSDDEYEMIFGIER
jgi:peroxiredoxin